MSTKEQRDSWQRLSDAATAGPWKAERPIPGFLRFVVADVLGWGIYPATNEPTHGVPAGDDADFIAAAREAVPALLQDVAALTTERDGAIDVADRQRSRAKDGESEVQRVKQERDAFQRALLDAWSEWSETTITELPMESLASVLRGALRRAGEVIRERDAVAARAAALYQFVNYVVTRSGSIAEMTDRAQVLVDEGPAEIGERIIAERDMLRSQVEHCQGFAWSQRAALMECERDEARLERDRANAARESAWKELQAARAEITRKDRACQEIAVRANDEINLARANAAVMRESLLWYQRGDYGIICRCEGAKMCELHKAYNATEGDAGRVLLAEVSRLREENAALKTTMEDEQAAVEALRMVKP